MWIYIAYNSLLGLFYFSSCMICLNAKIWRINWLIFDRFVSLRIVRYLTCIIDVLNCSINENARIRWIIDPHCEYMQTVLLVLRAYLTLICGKSVIHKGFNLFRECPNPSFSSCARGRMGILLCPAPCTPGEQRDTPISFLSLIHGCVFGQTGNNQSEILLSLP